MKVNNFNQSFTAQIMQNGCANDTRYCVMELYEENPSVAAKAAAAIDAIQESERFDTFEISFPEKTSRSKVKDKLEIKVTNPKDGLFDDEIPIEKDGKQIIIKAKELYNEVDEVGEGDYRTSFVEAIMSFARSFLKVDLDKEAQKYPELTPEVQKKLDKMV